MTDQEKQSYLIRREKLIEILDSLSDSWDLASGLSAFIGSSHVTPEVIDGVEKILQDTIREIHDEAAQAKMQEALEKIHDMQALELKERSEEQARLKSMGFDII
jgi:hypothetical protein